MFCTKCGSKINDGSLFCTNCGAKIENLSEKQVESQQVEEINNAREIEKVEETKEVGEVEKVNNIIKNTSVKKAVKKKSHGMFMFLFILILLLGGGIIFALSFLPKMGIDIKLPQINLPINKKSNNEKNTIYYTKNNSLYLADGEEEQEPSVRNFTSDFLLNKNTGCHYYIKNFSVYKLEKDEEETIERGEETSPCNSLVLFSDGVAFEHNYAYYIYTKNEKKKICSLLKTSPGVGSGATEIDYENNIAYCIDENGTLYKIDANGEKESIDRFVTKVDFQPGIGVVYAVSDDGTYIYNDGEKKKISDKILNLLCTPEYNKGYFYLYESKFLSGNADKYIDEKSYDKNNYVVQIIMSSLKNISIDRTYRYLYDYYIYDGEELKLLINNVVGRYHAKGQLVLIQSFVKDSSLFSLSDFGTNYSDPEYFNKIKSAIQDRFFITNKVLYYIFKGSEASLVEFDFGSINLYNSDKTNITARIRDDNKVKISYYDETNTRRCYIGDIKIGDITKVKLIVDPSSGLSLYGDSYMSKNYDEYSFDLYDETGNKLIIDNIFDFAKQDDKTMYYITDFDKNENYGTLYRLNIDNNEKERIATKVSGIYIEQVNKKIKNLEGVRINNFNFDSLNGDKIIDDYIKQYCVTGWVQDEIDLNTYYYYKPDHKKATNEFLEINDKWYHFNDNGVLDKNLWIEDYYYGEDGAMATNQWINNEYYVDESGKYKVNSWVGKSYLGNDGKKIYNQWVYPYYIGQNGEYVTNTTIDGKNIGADGRVIIEIKVPETTKTNTTENTNIVESENTTVSNSHADEDIYISGYLSIYKNSFEIDEDYDSTISIKLPIVKGKDEDEVNTINEYIEDVFTNELADELENRLKDVTPPYKSITITKAEVTSINKKNINIAVSGSAKKKSGSSSTVKYRIVYDREEFSCDWRKIS